MNEPLVSILFCTYNRQEMLKISLKSILEQNYKNIEIILIDDCSTDKTSEVINSFQDKRIKYIRNEKNIVGKHGATALWDIWLKYRKGIYFLNFSDDDFFPSNNFIRECVEKFLVYPTLAKVIGSQVNYYHNEEKDGKFRYYSLDDIKYLISQKDKKFYHHDKILPDGFLTGKKYLELYSLNPLGVNISTSGTLFSSQKFDESLTFKTPSYSKWQAGYEQSLPSSIIGDTYYINNPSVVVGLHPNNMSFNHSQLEHMHDQILSIKNSFVNLNKIKKIYLEKYNLNINVNFYKKIQKQMIINTCVAYLYHSIEIIKKNKISLCSDKNIKGYVRISDVLKTFFRNNIFLFIKKNIILVFSAYLILSMKQKTKNAFK
jgi:glycosyltransferase involved in cell wall biosynthesis